MTQQKPVSIRFGTDGWRAVIADEYTYDNVRACAQGVASYLKATGEAGRGVIVGFDTRFSSDRFGAAVAQVIAANGIPVKIFSASAPTPACSFGVVRENAAAGVMITASHNPGEWNGFKVKSAAGGSAPPEMVEQIERRVEAVLAGEEKVQTGSGSYEKIDIVPLFVEQLKRVLDVSPIKRSGLKVVVDSMHGSGSGIIKQVLEDGNIEVIEIRGEVNPAFPGMTQPEPVEHNLQPLTQAVRDNGADVGIATDGDADRVGIVDETGRYQSTLEVFSLLGHHLLGRRKEKGGIACTITMSNMVDAVCREFGQPVFRTAVGFKFVGPAMTDNDCVMGGEESGGYAFRGHIPERDGALSGLLYLEAMVMAGKKPSALLADLHRLTGPHTFRRIDAQFDADKRAAISEALKSAEPSMLGGLGVQSTDRRDGVRFELEGGSWAVARLSGTEPLARIYAEAHTDTERDAILIDLQKVMGI
ncbi:MAG: phosphoglucomutase/phosphomannomutase family protein [Chloroflexi bacterium]|nr:phosphoglucomutase/phosphomannomutase family protein [Chloroflexota bacterium]